MVPLINCHNFFVNSLNASIYDKLVKSIVVRCHGVSTDVKPRDWPKAMWLSGKAI